MSVSEDQLLFKSRVAHSGSTFKITMRTEGHVFLRSSEGIPLVISTEDFEKNFYDLDGVKSSTINP